MNPTKQSAEGPADACPKGFVLLSTPARTLAWHFCTHRQYIIGFLLAKLPAIYKLS